MDGEEPPTESREGFCTDPDCGPGVRHDDGNEPPIESDPIGDFVREVDEQVATGKVRLLFWTCRYPTHRGVKWEGDVALCLTCGATNA